MAEAEVNQRLQRAPTVKMMPAFMRRLLLLLTLSLAACKPAAPPVVATEPPPVMLPASARELPPAEAAAWMAANPEALILDLRMPEEITREGKLPGSQNHDFLQDATQEYLATLDRARPCLLYCALGGRSTHTAVQMHHLGFTQIMILKGGLNAWLKEGRSVVKQ